MLLSLQRGTRYLIQATRFEAPKKGQIPLPPTLAQGSELSLYRFSNLYIAPLVEDEWARLVGLAASRAAARFIPFGGAGRGPYAVHRFDGRVSQKVKLRGIKFTFVGYSTIKPLSRVRAAARTPTGINRAAAPQGPSKALLDRLSITSFDRRSGITK